MDIVEWLEAEGTTQAQSALDEIIRLRKALRISTNGLRHCANWNISEEKAVALMAVVMENEKLLAYPEITAASDAITS
jgi:hypothetical protein